MKGLKIIGLGIAIWGLSLLWPEINQLLSARVLAGLGVFLSVVILIYEFACHFLKRHLEGIRAKIVPQSVLAKVS